jgi:hypothetical protein
LPQRTTAPEADQAGAFLVVEPVLPGELVEVGWRERLGGEGLDDRSRARAAGVGGGRDVFGQRVAVGGADEHVDRGEVVGQRGGSGGSARQRLDPRGDRVA